MIQRRPLLRALATLPIAGRLAPDPRLPGDNHVMFWSNFRAAVKPGRALSTDWARKTAITDMDFERTSKGEVLQLLELAADRSLGLDSISDSWREYFGRVEQEYDIDHQDQELRNRHVAAVQQSLDMFNRYNE